jgi:hypothetical protein
MPRGDRGAVFAIGLVVGVALALLFLVWAVPQFRSPIRQPATHSSEEVDRGRPAADENGNEPQWWHWTRRLVAAEDTLAQWVMAFFAIAATAISYRAIVLVNETLKANTAAVEQARIANQVAKDALVIETRAWLKVHAAAPDPWHIRDGRLYASYVIHAMNHGQTPATHVRILLETVAVPPRDDDRFRAILRELIDKSKDYFSTSPVVFPKEPTNAIGRTFNLDVANVGSCYPRIYVCVVYKVVGSDVDHVSYKAFDAFSDNRSVIDAPDRSRITVTLREAMSEFIT